MRIAAALLLCAMAARSAAAQETTGDIRGRLRTSNGAPIAGATLVATSPDLLGVRRAVSASDGVFQFLSLPPGMYSIRVTAIGYRATVIDSVRVQMGRTQGLETSLEATTVQLSEVRIDAPRVTLDPARTTIGATLDAAELAALPGERDYKSLISIIPHANTSYHGDPVNVAGSTGLENAYFIDGVNVTSGLNGGTATTLPFNFVRAVEVRIGGYEAQYGKSLGAIVNAVTFTGTNEFESNVFGFMTHDALAMSPKSQPTLRETGSYSYDIGARMSGPVVRDRLWFSAAYNPRIAHADRLVASLGTFSENRVAQVFAGKLTWQARSTTNVEFSLFGDPTTHDQVSLWDLLNGLSPLNAEPYLQRIETGGVNAAVRATSTIGSSLLLEATAARSTARDNLLGVTERANDPLLIDWVSGSVEGGQPWTTTNKLTRKAATLRGTLSVGRHTAVIGAEYELNRDLNTFNNPGFGVILRNDVAAYETIDQTVDGQVQSQVPTAYVQDSWRLVNGLTLNAGLRWSGQWLAGDEKRTAQRFPDEWQPRVGFNWLLEESRTQRIFGSYGRFFLQEPLNLATLYYVTFDFIGKHYSSDPRQPGATLVDSARSITYQSDVPPVDDVEVENFDEFTAGYEQLFSDGTRLTIRGIHRSLRSSFQQGVDENGAFFLGTPGKGNMSFLPAPVRRHTALEVSVDGTWKRLEYRASYVLSRSVGNYTGLFSSDTYSANPGNNNGLGAFYQAENSFGLMPNDRPHVLKVVTIYRPASSFTLGSFATVMSGTPLNRFGVGPSYFPRFLAPRGSIGRTSSVWDLNLRLTWDRSVAGKDARFVIDMLHVGNPRTVVRVDQTRYRSENAYGNQSNPNPLYLAPTLYQPPMTARVGVEIGR